MNYFVYELSKGKGHLYLHLKNKLNWLEKLSWMIKGYKIKLL